MDKVEEGTFDYKAILKDLYKELLNIKNTA